jgi:NADH:ubiquinone oxidoreductase subunit H
VNNSPPSILCRRGPAEDCGADVTADYARNLSWFERKVVATFGRAGAMPRGPARTLQPLADGLKFLFRRCDSGRGQRFVYYLAPFLSLSLALTAIGIIPFGPEPLTIFGQQTPLAVSTWTWDCCCCSRLPRWACTG